MNTASSVSISDALAPLVDVVALFMDNSVDEVREAIAHARPTLLSSLQKRARLRRCS